MKGPPIFLLLLVSFGIEGCFGKGAPWSKDDQDIIFQKLKMIARDSPKVQRQYQHLYPDRKYNIGINAAKVSNLGLIFTIVA